MTVTINEIRIDQPGADTGEFFELFGAPGESLDGLSYVVIGDGTGGSGVIEAVVDLSGLTLDADGRLLVAESTMTEATPDLVASLNFENSDNVTHLLVRDFTGAVGDDLDAADDGTLDVTPWSAVLDGLALIQDPAGGDQVYSATRLGPDGSFVPGHAYRAGDGSGAWTIGDFGGADITPGAANGDGGTVPPTYAAVAINEIRVDEAGADDNEFFELFGTAGGDLSDLSYVVIGDGAGGSGVVESVTSLAGLSLDADGLFLAAESTFTGEAPDLVTTLNFENSDNVTHLLVRYFTGANGDDLDLDDDGVLDVTPWGEVVDSVALIETEGAGDLVYSDTHVGPDGDYVPGHVFRLPDGTGDWRIGDFGGADVTAGRANDAPPEVTALTIMQIQGAGHVSAYDNQRVATSGIVTAVASNGFYLQDALGDGDIATSDAVFVFTGGAPGVAVGDAAEVTGVVDEYTPGGSGSGNLSTTEITGTVEVTVTSSGNALPEAVLIGEGGRVPPSQVIDDDAFTSFDPTTDGIDFFESMEGMRVTAQDLMAVSGTNSYGEIFAVVDRGADATGLSERGTLNISPDDFNPERIQIDFDGAILDYTFPEVDTGALLGDVTGVIGYDFGNFQIFATEDFTDQVIDSTLEREVTDLVRTIDDLTVATYNVLNLDPKVESIDAVNGNSAGEIDDDLGDGRFDAIAQQIVENLRTPDILGLQEIQDNTGAEINDGVTSASETLQLLIDKIVEAGGPRYAYVDNTFITEGESGGQPGGNIRTAFLYDPTRVDLVEDSVRTIGSQEPGDAFAGARLPLVADFEFNGETVTIVNNHLSSKGGSAPIMGTEQPFEALQENVGVNGSLDERQAQSEAVQDFVSQITGEGGNAIVLGDFNEYEFVSPVTGLEEAGLRDLAMHAVEQGLLTEDEVYSYIFQGNSQALDHILASAGLLEGAQFDYVHVNSEFAETPVTASDHDPGLSSFHIELPRLTLGVELEARGRFLTRAKEMVGGELADRDPLGPLRAHAEFTDAGIRVDAEGPARIELLAFDHGQMGVRSLDDGLWGFDTRAVDGGERLVFDVAKEGLGDAVSFDFSFGEVRGGGDVAITLFDDGVALDTFLFNAASGEDLSGDLLGRGFDRAEISAVGDTMFTLDGFAFDAAEDPGLLV